MSSYHPSLWWLLPIAFACSPTQQQTPPGQSATVAPSSVAGDDAVHRDGNVQADDGKTAFALGRVRLRLPEGVSLWTPPPTVNAQMGDRPGALWYARESPALRLMISRDEDLPQSEIPVLCSPDQGVSTDALAAVGAAFVAKRLIERDGVTFCRLETLSGDTVVTVQLVGVVEGHAFVIAAFYSHHQRAVIETELDALLASFDHVPTTHGSPCDESEQATMCPDDSHMAVCKDGRWTITSCEEMCQRHGGHGEECARLDDQYACYCRDLPPDAFDH